MKPLQQRKHRSAKDATRRAEDQTQSRKTSSSITDDSRMRMDHDTFDMQPQPRCRWIKRESDRRIPVIFLLNAPAASDVRLAGEFTAWNTAPLYLARNSDGVWATKITLQPGRYEYKFIVDGQWISDPQCAQSVPNGYGSVNSVAEIKA